jgi:hypothetical protein
MIEARHFIPRFGLAANGANALNQIVSRRIRSAAAGTPQLSLKSLRRGKAGRTNRDAVRSLKRSLANPAILREGQVKKTAK